MGCAISSAPASLADGPQLRIGGQTLPNDSYPQRLNLEAKIVLLGDSGVGKSSLALRFCRGRFPQLHEVTIGAAFLQQTVRVDQDGSQIKLYIWDTGGQERFRAMAPLYYRDAAGALVVYDMNQPQSFEAVKFWVDELRQRGPSNCLILIAANKCDHYVTKNINMDASQPEQQTTLPLEKLQDPFGENSIQHAFKNEMMRFCENEGMLFVECSAKTGYNVNFLFEEMAKRIFSRLRNSLPDRNPAFY